MSDSLNDLEQRVWKMDAESSLEDVILCMNQVKAVKDRVKEIDRVMTDKVIAFIRHNGPFSVGPIRYYVGNAKTTKCVDLAIATETLLPVCSIAIGDADLIAFVGLLSSNAYKHGAARALLTEKGQAELYDVLFQTKEEPELKEGKPKLQAMNTDFIKR